MSYSYYRSARWRSLRLLNRDSLAASHCYLTASRAFRSDLVTPLFL